MIGVLAAAGCAAESGPQPGQGTLYSAIIDALIEQGACSSRSDCERKDLVFWEAGGGKVFFNIYSAGDPQLRSELKAAVEAARSKEGIAYPVVLAFHTESKQEALEKFLPPSASYTEEVH